jgi:flagellin-like protein
VSRGTSPVVGVVLLVAVTVAVAGAVGTFAAGVDPSSPAPTVSVALAADADGQVVLRHRGGDDLAVADLRVRVAVDGRPLEHQPPVPFVGAAGFAGAPGGPFNAAGDGTWTAGERATLRIADTNDPQVEAGDRVSVRLVVDDVTVWEGSTTAG